MDLQEWLTLELAQVEAAQQGGAPICQLDRLGNTPPALKRLEGRAFVLRRAARLIERGEGLERLRAEADKARLFLGPTLAADGTPGPDRSALWQAYFEAVLEAVEQLLSRSDPGLRP